MKKAIRPEALFVGVVVLVLIPVSGFFFLRSSRGFREPTYQGRNIGQWVEALAADRTDPQNALNIKRILIDEETETVRFETPLSYDLVAKHDFLTGDGRLRLCIDGNLLSSFCERGTNGNCLLYWDKRGIPPGLHQVQVCFFIVNESNKCRMLSTKGAVSSFVLTNICRIKINPYIASSYFKGVILYANLSGSNASYSIELQTPEGDHVKTINGNTTNGIINERWNLVGDGERIYANPTVNAVFHVTLADSLSGTKSQVYHIESP